MNQSDDAGCGWQVFGCGGILGLLALVALVWSAVSGSGWWDTFLIICVVVFIVLLIVGAIGAACESVNDDSVNVRKTAHQKRTKRKRRSLVPGPQRQSTFQALNDRPRRREPLPRSVKNLLFQQSGGRCAGCRDKFRQIGNLQVDHIKPVKLGGRNDLKNLQLLCRSCNTKKGTGTMPELIAKLRRDGIRK